MKKGACGDEMRYQLRIQRYIEWDVTDKKTGKVSGVEWTSFRNLCYNIGKIIYYSLSLIFFCFEDASCLYLPGSSVCDVSPTHLSVCICREHQCPTFHPSY